MKYNYKIAWSCLLVVLKNGYDIGCWIAPIPEEHKEKLLLNAKKYLAKKKSQMELFEE